MDVLVFELAGAQLGMVKDITERKEAELGRERVLDTVTEVSARLSSASAGSRVR